MRDFVDAAGAELGIAIRWKGKGVDEKGYDELGNCIVAVDPRYFRPDRGGNAARRRHQGAQQARLDARTSFTELVAEMVREDLKAAERDELVKKHGYSAYDYHE